MILGVTMARDPERTRGVRLGDLDRRVVYRLGYVGRRWEILGPESDAGADAPGSSGGGSRDPLAGGEPHRSGRHVAPDRTPD